MEYLTNIHVWQSLESLVRPEDAITGASKERVAKLPWNQREFIEMPFSKRDEYIRTHQQNIET